MRRAAAAALLALALGAGAQTALELMPGASFKDWEERRFEGATRYRSVVEDGVAAVRAEARASASGLYREDTVSLARWPLLRWQWRVAGTLEVADERSRSGDDFAARVYVIAADPVFFWRTRAVCYVWASRAKPGDSWPNPYTANVVMVALRSGDAQAGRWLEERRDVAADFVRFFGEAPEEVDAVAVMTDTDQTGTRATAWYAGLRFEKREGAASE